MEQLKSSFRAVSERFQSGFRAVSEQFCNAFLMHFFDGITTLVARIARSSLDWIIPKDSIDRIS